MQTISIIGNVANPEHKKVNGKSVLNFSVAVNTKTKGEEKVTWYRCALWENAADALVKYLTKGTKVGVSGELDVREYNGKTYLEIPFCKVTLCGSKPKDDLQSREAEPEPDIPF